MIPSFKVNKSAGPPLGRHSAGRHDLGENETLYQVKDDALASDLARAISGIVVYTSLPVLGAEFLLNKIASAAATSRWAVAARGLGLARGPLLYVLGYYAGQKASEKIEETKKREKIKKLQSEVQDIKQALQWIRGQNEPADYAVYFHVSKIVKNATEISGLYSSQFMEEIQEEEQEIHRLNHCWPFEMNIRGTYNEDGALETITRDTESEIATLRTRHSNDLRAAENYLRETLTYVESFQRADFFDLAGRLREAIYVLQAYSTDEQLANLWRTQGQTLLESSGEVRALLDNVWLKTQDGQTLSPAEKESYQSTLEYIDRKIFENADLDHPYTCLGLPGIPAVERRAEVR